MKNDEDKLLDEEQWKLEAQAVINDIKDHVIDVKISDRLCNTNQVIYLNLTTLENLTFCIELSSAGFTIVGNKYDDSTNKGNEYFETFYSLLNSISLRYRNSFGNLLLEKLEKLEKLS
ncbi:PREDICTED: GSK3-beta interaction protein [Polistes dominula]|uniref:GSK3-beta interaction protein n=1 Tax=Polistes dominula TaxID=743375 RepID=A0ABM1JGY7_POLDO|nr:PREDICTED: GSK3-beta interaction protein [Polistes dominula]